MTSCTRGRYIAGPVSTVGNCLQSGTDLTFTEMAFRGFTQGLKELSSVAVVRMVKRKEDLSDLELPQEQWKREYLQRKMELNRKTDQQMEIVQVMRDSERLLIKAEQRCRNEERLHRRNIRNIRNNERYPRRRKQLLTSMENQRVRELLNREIKKLRGERKELQRDGQRLQRRSDELREEKENLQAEREHHETYGNWLGRRSEHVQRELEQYQCHSET